MALSAPSRTQKTLYGVFFAAIFPLLLILWAQASERMVPLRAPTSVGLGIAVGSLGVLCMLAGMTALWTYGKGLPMNLAPPPRYVTQGIYRLLPHPVYTGFCLA